MRQSFSGATNAAGSCRSASVFGSRIAFTTRALLAPETRNSIILALLITPRVMVSVVGGSFGDGVWIIKLWSSRRAGAPENREVVYPSSSSPRRTGSRVGGRMARSSSQEATVLHSKSPPRRGLGNPLPYDRHVMTQSLSG